MIDRRRLVGGAASCLISFPCASQELTKFAKSDRLIVFRNSWSHRVLSSDAFRYTFGKDDLALILADGRASIIVHHGKTLASPKYDIIHRHFEGLPLFVPKQAGVTDIKLSQLIDLLKGKLQRWKQLGGNDVDISIAIRKDGVYGSAINHQLQAASKNLGPHSQVDSYGELAEYGKIRPGALLLGLRGVDAHDQTLAEISLDGKTIATSKPYSYPLTSQITVFMRKNDKEAVVLASQFEETLINGAAADDLRVEAQKNLQILHEAIAARK